jgi:hypothetical protein
MVRLNGSTGFHELTFLKCSDDTPVVLATTLNLISLNCYQSSQQTESDRIIIKVAYQLNSLSSWVITSLSTHYESTFLKCSDDTPVVSATALNLI